MGRGSRFLRPRRDPALAPGTTGPGPPHGQRIDVRRLIEGGENPMLDLPTYLSRRSLLQRSALGLGALGLGGLLGDQGLLGAEGPSGDAMAVKPPHFPGRAKRVVHFSLNGGPSQV